MRLLSEYQGNLLLNKISDNIEKCKTKSSIANTNDDIPLFVEQIGRLREIFEEALSMVNDSKIGDFTKLGQKLNKILNTYPIDQSVTDNIFAAWDKVNKARHFQKLKAEGEVLSYQESHYKKTIRFLCGFIFEYSGVPVSEKMRSYYQNPSNSFVKEKIIPVTLSSKELQAKILSPRQVDLWTIPDTRLPILFVLDISLSMNMENRIEDLNTGVKYFYECMESEEITGDSVELAIITFGDKVDHLLKFSSINSAAETCKNLQLEANGMRTCLGEAMLEAVKVSVNIKNVYRNEGVSYHQPWIILITDCDGQGMDNYKDAAEKVNSKIAKEKIVLFPIAVGSANQEVLRTFALEKDVLLMGNKKFGEFFRWLKENALFFAQSRPDETPPFKTPEDWILIKP
jgi:uncharacterized protein YegL